MISPKRKYKICLKRRGSPAIASGDAMNQGSVSASPALIYWWAIRATESPITFWENTDGIRVLLAVTHHALFGFLDMTLVEQSGSHNGVMASCVRHWGRDRVPGHLPPPLQAEVNIQSCPAMKGQGVEESLHGVQDPLKEHKYRTIKVWDV